MDFKSGNLKSLSFTKVMSLLYIKVSTGTDPESLMGDQGINSKYIK
jgi:hypothetical protein